MTIWEDYASEANEHLAQAKMTWHEYEIAVVDDPDENKNKLRIMHQRHAMYRQMPIAGFLAAIVNHDLALDSNSDTE